MTPETPQTDSVIVTLYGCEMVPANSSRKLERERNELYGYLCRIKLPLPVKFIADMAKLFPGKNISMKDVDGYLCIFQTTPKHS